jgi:uncharacterized protein YbbK (DUF523 family)
MILVSSCLLGIFSKYDGGSNLQPLLAKYCHRGKFLPVCPEQLGGLPTPRRPVEIVDGCGEEVLAGTRKAISQDGTDVSEPFCRGAQEVAALAASFPVTAAILKERSPSCGVNRIYDGSFSHVVKPGRGVTASRLNMLNIPLYSEEDITEKLLCELLAEK